jgi:hypothetical protein
LSRKTSIIVAVTPPVTTLKNTQARHQFKVPANRNTNPPKIAGVNIHAIADGLFRFSLNSTRKQHIVFFVNRLMDMLFIMSEKI